LVDDIKEDIRKILELADSVWLEVYKKDLYYLK
jgi:hypothetical protein